ncbi:hypothetical protein FA95DRAFT_1576981 [Auriscalpium vulgare]|uniref:Uncharacterized protein n=1 Tax=Auriscalpium vulgare TaxID=40419 RepID=A0ACB8R909_9AGAM|nr:hypothetical protein FA95DRAFT_1576981 [Auriscalpium vulgare]
MTRRLCQAIELINFLTSIARWAAEMNHPRLAEIRNTVRLFVNFIALYPGTDNLMAGAFDPMMDAILHLEMLLANPLAPFGPVAPDRFFPRQIGNIIMRMPGPSFVYRSIDYPFVCVPDAARTLSTLPPQELVLRVGSVCYLIVNITPVGGWSANTLVVVQHLTESSIIVKNLIDSNMMLLPRWLFVYFSIHSNVRHTRIQFPLRVASHEPLYRLSGSSCKYTPAPGPVRAKCAHAPGLSKRRLAKHTILPSVSDLVILSSSKQRSVAMDYEEAEE